MRIEVSQLPPVECSLNWRGHWAKRYRAAKEYQEVVYYEAVNARNLFERSREAPLFSPFPFQKARLKLTFVFRLWQDRDENNLRTRFKPGQDALVQAELIIADSMGHLILDPIEVVIDRRQSPKTIIELEEVL